MAAEGDDVVWAMHAFEAENPDEISFLAGEPIVILERDDMFGDGWWQGRNVSGQVGLFPESYTSKTKTTRALIPQTNGKSSTISAISEESTEHGAPQPAGAALMMQSTLTEVDRAIQQQQEQTGLPYIHLPENGDNMNDHNVDARSFISYQSRNTADDAASVHSHDDHSAVPQEVYPNARSALAAKAKLQLDQAAQAAKDRERARQLDEQRFMQEHESPPIAGLELSDESDDETDEQPHFSHFYEQPSAVSGLAQRRKSAESLAPVGQDASGVPLPDTQPNSPVPNATSFPGQQVMIPLVSATAANASIARGHSPSPSLSSRRSRKSFDASSMPPVPPVPAVLEEPASKSRPTSFTDDIRRSLSLSRRSSKQSLKRRASISSQKRPLSSVQLSEPVTVEGRVSSDSTRTSQPLEENPRSIPRTKSFAEIPASYTSSQNPDDFAPATQSLDSNQRFQTPIESTAIVPGRDSVDQAQPSQNVERRRSESLVPETVHQYSAPQSSLRQQEQAPLSPHVLASPMTTATFSRPGSQTGYTTTANANSIRTSDTSPRSSMGGKLPQDPRVWTVDQVMEWGRSKGFDALTLSKFQEHEISGDVLLEMDINTLKEIDLPAFGRRVHINNGIKELKRMLDPSVSPANTMLSTSQASYAQFQPPQSPGISGYDPDTPNSRYAFSPSDNFSPHGNQRDISGGSMMSMSMQPINLQQAPEASIHHRSASEPFNNFVPRESTESARLRGLGFDGESSSAPMQRASTDLGAARPKTSLSIATTGFSSNGHRRTHTEGTMDTFNTAADSTLMDVDEEGEHRPDRGAFTDTELVRTESRRSRALSRKNSSVASVSRTSSRRRTSTEPEQTIKRTSFFASPSAPSSPEVGRTSLTKKGSSFITSTLRGRKAPPRASSSTFGTQEAEKPSRTPLPSRRSTKLFGFGLPQSSPVSPVTVRPKISTPFSGEPPQVKQEPIASRRSDPLLNRNLTDEPEDDPSIDTAEKPKGAAVTDPLTQIGKPDLDGWMRKKSERYGTWKQRYVILKDMYLYLLKSPYEKKVKGWIPLAGYKILPDADSNRGSYGFKMIHPSLPPHYFSSEDPLIVRKFMKALMKSSIKRDYKAPVVTSSNIPTMSLEEAQSMFPPPRPPSPTSRDRLQKERLGGINPNSLSQRDAEILTSLQKSTPPSAPPPPKSSKRESMFGSLRASSNRDRRSFISDSGSFADQASPETATFASASPVVAQRSSTLNPDTALLNWVNAHLPTNVNPATNFNTSFQSGERLTRLIEAVSGQTKTELQGDNRFKLPAGSHDSFGHVDALLDYFDFLLDLKVDTKDVSVAEVLRGDTSQVIKLITSIREHFGQEEVLM